jgi:hypothetical protein
MLSRAFAKLRRRPGPVLALAALNLALALLASAPLSAPLARLLDDRPAAAAIADSADDGPRLELLQDHPELASTAIESALLALLAGGALSLVVAGGLLSANDEPFPLACARHARRMLAVGAAGLPLRFFSLLPVAATWPLAARANTFGGVAASALAGLVVFGAAWSLATVTLDRARGLALAQPELSAWRAVRAALTASRSRFGSTLGLALFSTLGFCGVTALQLTATRALPPAGWGSALALALGVLGAVGRAAFSAVTLFAAAGDAAAG